jgi:hypothetical protein
MAARWSRRDLLAGAASLGALSTSSLLNLAAAPGQSRRLILVVVNGGWDVTFALDPKSRSAAVDGPMIDQDPNDPEDVEAVETFGAFPIQVNDLKRPQVRELFERYHDRLCLINGIWVGTISHFEARTRMITGTDDRHAPDLATVAGVVAGQDKPVVAVDLSGLGRVGPYADRTANYGRKGQLAGVVNPQQRMPSTREEGIRGTALDPADRGALHGFLAERRAVDPRRERPRGEEIFAAQDEAVARAERLLGLQIPDGSVETLQGQMGLAMSLLQAGVCHTVTVGTPSFDSHNNGDNQHVRWNELCGDIGFLLSQMELRGMTRDTTVAVVSEFGRTPLRNVVGGTDHFPHTSALLFGSGITQGRLIGGTNELVQSLPMDMVTGEADPAGSYLRPEQFVAGLLETLDVDPGEWLPGVTPFRAFHQG